MFNFNLKTSKVGMNFIYTLTALLSFDPNNRILVLYHIGQTLTNLFRQQKKLSIYL